VALTDGRQTTHSCDSHRGDFQRPFSEAEIREKFRELAGVVLTPEGVSRVEQAVDRCEAWKGVDDLTELLRRHGLSAPS
jgi:2-methylcitrate dehydratase PrpD